MTVLGMVGNAVQLAISGTTGLGSLFTGLAQAGYGMYADRRDYEADRADTAWNQQMQEQLRQDSLAQQQYEDQVAAQQYQDALAQQKFDNDVTSQKLAIAQGEWNLKRTQAQQEAAAASAKAAARSASGGSSGSSSKSSGSSSKSSSSSGTAASGSGMDYTTFARNMRAQGYTIDEIKAMFDAMR